MKTLFILFLVCVSFLNTTTAQTDDGVVSLDLPIRNSLMFHRSLVNPTFSFVKEQNTNITAYNKREWIDFENAPLTYLASYSGRMSENIGAGVSLFQQNYGVLTTFGGVLNFAYNARLQKDSNLTFGLNIGAYSSGINTSKVLTNFADPSLQNVPSNFLVTVNPGINYGNSFLDFGVSINNLAIYNLQTSQIVENDQNQALQAHAMYTGYIPGSGFFEDAKFTGLLRSEFNEDETVISGNAMLSVPKGIWIQGGYNTRFGASAGFGINITKALALEYNYETAFGNLNIFGASHEFTLAYRLKSERYFDYSSEDEIEGIVKSNTKRKPSVKKPKPIIKTEAPIIKDNKQVEIEEANKQAKLIENQKAKEAAEKRAQLLDLKAERERDAQKLKDEQAKQEEALKVAQAKQLETPKVPEVEENDTVSRSKLVRKIAERGTKRRIKRATSNNEDERYAKDRETLKNLKKQNSSVNEVYKSEDFDFGTSQSETIQILKTVNNTENGYYAVLAVHTDVIKRDDFVKKALASGLANVDFFYDVNTRQYYIYAEKYDTIQQANSILAQKANKPYNTNMTLIKIEN